MMGCQDAIASGEKPSPSPNARPEEGFEALGLPWGAQVAKGVVEGPSRVPNRKERRRARTFTHTMLWRICASENMRFL